jgi:hypothetical protein
MQRRRDLRFGAILVFVSDMRRPVSFDPVRVLWEVYFM